MDFLSAMVHATASFSRLLRRLFATLADCTHNGHDWRGKREHRPQARASLRGNIESDVNHTRLTGWAFGNQTKTVVRDEPCVPDDGV